MELKELEKPPFTEEQLREYANASGDLNPLHLNEIFAKEAGFESVVVHGMLSMAYLGDCLRLSFPENEFKIEQFQTRFRKVIFPGDGLRCGGTGEKEDSKRWKISLWAKNQSGDLVADGEARVASISAVGK